MLCIRKVKPFQAKDLTELQATFCSGEYSGWLREGIIGYKNGKASYSTPLAIVLEKTLTMFLSNSAVTLVPIPSSDLKIRERGFDSMTQICKHLVNANSGLKLDSTNLFLRRNVADQVGLSAALRRQNLEGAFGARRNVSGTHILVDDVITTGATLNSAATTLKLAGAQHVFALALCGTPKTR